ncbi:MAG: bifunctional pyr operon transcriptional regulator/uracil phosphoribosyltransferase PyrR [Janthinobacterium lividum]
MKPFDAEALYRILYEQVRQAYGDQLFAPDGVALVGIHSGGAWLAERFAADLAQDAPDARPASEADAVRTSAPAATQSSLPFGVVNVALHRDDYAHKGLHARPSPTQLPFSVEGRRILLLDDVLFTGRTIRAALNELYDYGRPASVELAVLVDRGERELPVAARFVGCVAEVPRDRTLVLTRADDGSLTFDTEPSTEA